MLNYIKGDLFRTVSPNAVLAHACNPFGLWGGGIAAVFRQKYPGAYVQYADFCHQHSRDPKALLGKCLVIPTEGIYIACLFTSDFESSPDEIIEFTRKSLLHLATQVNNLHLSDPKISMPKINSGIFNVPWESTEAVLKEAKSLSFEVYTL